MPFELKKNQAMYEKKNRQPLNGIERYIREDVNPWASQWGRGGWYHESTAIFFFCQLNTRSIQYSVTNYYRSSDLPTTAVVSIYTKAR